jgi:hypothetical protein
MTASSLLRSQDVHALLEACALARLGDALDELIAIEDERAGTDAVAEYCAAAFRRRRDAIRAEHQAVLDRIAEYAPAVHE